VVDFYRLDDRGRHDITGLLMAWKDRNAGALDRLIDLMYPELQRIAREHFKRRLPGGSLESAAPANRAYLMSMRAEKSSLSEPQPVGHSYHCHQGSLISKRVTQLLNAPWT
jgi:hypothetical protein